MPLGFGDRSTVELLLEIKGRNDAASAVDRAAADMAKLAAANKVFNETTKAQNALMKSNNDLRRAAHDVERLEQSRAALGRNNGTYNRFDNPDRYVNDLAKAEASLRRIRQVENEAGNKVWQGLRPEHLEAIQHRLDSTGMSMTQFAERMRAGQEGIAGFTKEKDIQVIADKLSNLARAQEAAGIHADELAVRLANAETSTRNLAAAQKEIADPVSARNVVRDLHDLENARREGDRALQNSARLTVDAGRVLGDFAKDNEKVVKDVDRTSNALFRGAKQFDQWSRSTGRAGVGVFRIGQVLKAPLEGIEKFLSVAGHADQFFSRFVGMFGPAAGPISAMLGLITALGVSLAVLPGIIAGVVAAWTTFTGVIGAGLAVLVGFIPPLALLATLLGGLGLGFGLVLKQGLSNASSPQQIHQLQLQTEAAHKRFQHDLSSGAAHSSTLTALKEWETAKQKLSQAREGIHIDTGAIQKDYHSLIDTLSKRFAPAINSGIKGLQGWLKYLDQVAKMPLSKAFASLSTTGVNRFQHDLEGIAGTVGPIIRKALLFAFSDSGDIRNKMVHDWNQLMNFLSGPRGALNPVAKWFDAQHFTKIGLRWANEFNNWLANSGILGNITSLLGSAVANGIKQGLKAGFSFLKTESGLITAGAIGGGLIAKSVAGSLIGAVGAKIAGSILGTAAGTGAASAGVSAGQLSLFGAAGSAGGLLGAGGVSATALASILAPIAVIAVEGYLSTTAPRLTPAQRVMQLTLPFGTRTSVDGVPTEAGFGAARFGKLKTSAIQAFVDQLSAHGGFGNFSRADTIGGAAAISRLLGLNHRATEFNRSFSLQAGRPLAPNELLFLSQHMRSRAGIATFTRLSGGRLPNESAVRAIGTGSNQQAIAALIAEEKKIPTNKEIHILSDIPHVALPAVIHLIRELHHMPTKKELRVAIKGAEEEQKKIENLKKKFDNLERTKHLIKMEGGNTHSVDQKISGIQHKLDALGKNRHDVGRGLYLKPAYPQITQNAHAIGQSVDAGIAAGITANTGLFDPAIAAAASSIMAKFKSQLKIGSPSKRAGIEIGVPIITGITWGMMKAIKASNSSNSAKSVMQTMLQTMLGVFDNFKSQFQQGFGDLFTGPFGGGVNPKTGFPTRLATLMSFPGTKIPFSAVSGDLRSQLQTFKKFSHSLNRLQAMGYPLLLIQQIAALGPSAQPEIDALLGANKSQVHQYRKMFNESQKFINSASMKQSINQLDIWKSAGKGVAVGILAGLRSAEPQVEQAIADMISRILGGRHRGHGHSGTHPHTVVHQTIHASPHETLDRTMRRASFHYRHVAG